jgi:hypothetical protein
MMRQDLNLVFDRCLEKLQSGSSLAEVLAEYPEWADELRPVLESVMALWQARGSDTVPVAAMTRSRARLNEEAQRRRAVERQPSLWRWLRTAQRVTVPAMISLVVVGLALTGLSVKALPGEALYPVKIGAERLTLSLPATASDRLIREETYDTRRFAEVQSLRDQQREQEVFFVGDLTLEDDGIWRIGKIPLNVPVEMEKDLAELVGQYIFVHADLMPDGRLVLEWFESRQYTFSGRVQEVDGTRIRIDTVWAEIGSAVAGQWTPTVGQRVTVSVVRLADGRLMVVKLKIIPNTESNEAAVLIATTEKPDEQDDPPPAPTASPAATELSKDEADDKPIEEQSITLTATNPVEATPEPTGESDDEDQHEEKTAEFSPEPEPTGTPE